MLVFDWKTKETKSLQGHQAEFRTVQSSFRVRQNDGVTAAIPGPPTRNPSSRIHRCTGPNLPRLRALGEASPR
jgi:hypothetical protein